jgi:rod shape-determining protein MreC
MPPKFFSPKRAKLIAVLAISALLVLLNPRGYFNFLRSFFLRVSYPVQKTFYLLSGDIREKIDFLRSISDLNEENKRLIKESNLLSAEIAGLKDEKNQNKLLRDQLGLAPKDKFELEASFVIGQDPERSGSWIMADKGSSSGIKEGMPVVVGNGILIGKVSEVYSSSSKVRLLTDPASVLTPWMSKPKRKALSGESTAWG